MSSYRDQSPVGDKSATSRRQVGSAGSKKETYVRYILTVRDLAATSRLAIDLLSRIALGLIKRFAIDVDRPVD